MTKTIKQRDHEIIKERRHAARARLEGVVLCKCGATFDTFDEKCAAALSVLCDGFVGIELAIYPDGGTVKGLAAPGQIERCRAALAKGGA